MAENAKMLDRATYKKIKGMTREEMQNFLTNYYNNSLKLSITLDTLTARMLKLSSDSQSRI